MSFGSEPEFRFFCFVFLNFLIFHCWISRVSRLEKKKERKENNMHDFFLFLKFSNHFRILYSLNDNISNYSLHGDFFIPGFNIFFSKRQIYSVIMKLNISIMFSVFKNKIYTLSIIILNRHFSGKFRARRLTLFMTFSETFFLAAGKSRQMKSRCLNL